MELFDFFLVLDVVIYSIVLFANTVCAAAQYFYLVAIGDNYLDAFFKLKNVYLNVIATASFVSLICLHRAAYVYFFTSQRNSSVLSVEDANFIFFCIPLISVSLNVAYNLWDLIFK